MAHIFISYRRKDRDAVVQLNSDLEELGHEPWFDRDLSMTGGQKWWANVLEQIRRCDIFLFALSPDSLVSDAARREYRYAYALNKPIIPVMLTEVDIAALPSELQELQYVDFRQHSRQQALNLGASLSRIQPRPLPDPLPDEPETPLPIAAKLSQRLEAESLTAQEQVDLLFQLDTMYENPATRATAQELMWRLYQRPDVIARVAEKIVNRVPKGARKSRPQQPSGEDRSDQSGAMPGGRGGLVALGVIVILLIVGGIALRSLTPPGSPSGTDVPSTSIAGVPTATPTVPVVPSNTRIPPSATLRPTRIPPTATAVPTKTRTPTKSPVPPTATRTKPAGKVDVVWFVGLGTGSDAAQLEPQQKVVDAFNKSQDSIRLKLEIVGAATALDVLLTRIAAGDPPDIIGPMGIRVSNILNDETLDLKALIEAHNYDLSAYPQTLLDLYKTSSGGYKAIPYMVFPSAMYYNQDLFDEAGITYPPQKFGDKYHMPDGSLVDWNYDTVATIAQMLTVDSNGNSATSANFDPSNVVQYGMNFQWSIMRSALTHLQPATLYNPQTNKVTIPTAWRNAAKWVSNALWKSHFMPNLAADSNFTPNAFASGQVAMAVVPLWYTCCLRDSPVQTSWNLGVVPMSFDGKYHSLTDADSFYILKSSKNPDAAFEVLTYLLDDAVPDLAPIYGIYSARPEYMQLWVEARSSEYTQGVNWQVFADSLPYTNPADQNHEDYTPNPTQVEERFRDFYALLLGEGGGSINIDQEIDKLESDLQTIVNGQ